MREIKFRAWLKNEHKMVEVAEISWQFQSITYLDKESNTYFEALFDEIELMQYTGLKDKNRTEIYEGDILEVKACWDKAKKQSNASEFEKGVTYWSVAWKNYLTECGFMTIGIDKRWHQPINDSRLYNADAKVVGNLYENPELMEV